MNHGPQTDGLVNLYRDETGGIPRARRPPGNVVLPFGSLST